MKPLEQFFKEYPPCINRHGGGFSVEPQLKAVKEWLQQFEKEVQETELYLREKAKFDLIHRQMWFSAQSDLDFLKKLQSSLKTNEMKK